MQAAKVTVAANSFEAVAREWVEQVHRHYESIVEEFAAHNAMKIEAESYGSSDLAEGEKSQPTPGADAEDGAVEG